jgi:hypothetical protein
LQPALQTGLHGQLLLLLVRRDPALVLQVQGQTDQALPLLLALLLLVMAQVVRRDPLALLLLLVLQQLLVLAHHPSLSSSPTAREQQPHLLLPLPPRCCQRRLLPQLLRPSLLLLVVAAALYWPGPSAQRQHPAHGAQQRQHGIGQGSQLGRQQQQLRTMLSTNAQGMHALHPLTLHPGLYS